MFSPFWHELLWNFSEILTEIGRKRSVDQEQRYILKTCIVLECCVNSFSFIERFIDSKIIPMQT